MKRTGLVALAAIALAGCGRSEAPETADASEPAAFAEPRDAPPKGDSPDLAGVDGAVGAGCEAEPTLTAPIPDAAWEHVQMPGGRVVSFPRGWAADLEYLELMPTAESDLTVGIGLSVRTAEATERRDDATDWRFWSNSVVPASVPRTEEALPKDGCLLTGSDGIVDFAVSIWPVSDVEAKWVRAVIPRDATPEDRDTAMTIVLSPASSGRS